MTEHASDEFEIIDELADSFVARVRRGEQPDIEEFVARHPDLADRLRELLPAIAMFEHHAAACEADGRQRATKVSDLTVPKEIGEFTIVREIGRGGMGVVYEAVQESLARRVALKVLSLPGLTSAKHLERFRFEAKAAARLQHRHIVPVFGVGECAGMHYYAMQYIAGQSLHEVLAALRSGTCGQAREHETDLPESTDATNDAAIVAGQQLLNGGRPGKAFYCAAARIGLQAAEALAYAHHEGLLHRDIKPSNLLLDASGNVWVTDFGLAKIEGIDGLTETGDFFGTLRYMAPERLEGALDRRSDVYSLGATLYELLTRQIFFETKSHAQLVDHILHEAPPAPSRFDRSMPRDLETIVLKAIAKEPAARYRTAEEMAEDLRRFLADKPILARRPAASEQFVRWCRRNPIVASLAGTVGALLIGAVVLLSWSNARIRSEAAAREQALASARDSVHQLLTRVASEKLSDMPLGHPLRVALLEDAIKAYEGLIAMGDTDVEVRQQMADVLHIVAGLQRELGHYGDAAASLERSATLYQTLANEDHNSLANLESLAMVQSDLAFTWQSDVTSPVFDSYPIEAQYRKALATYENVEAKWPGRHEPVTSCLRYLADAANRRGDRGAAEKLWSQAISRGEAHLAEQPQHFQAHNDVCWACSEYYEAILHGAPGRSAEASATLEKGLHHALEMRQENPESTQAADVLAAIQFRQAIVACEGGRIGEAIPVFRNAIHEIETLCASFPWNADYWNTAEWFQHEAIKRLHQAGRESDVDLLVRETSAWLAKMASLNSSTDFPRERLKSAQASFAKLLRSLGRDAGGAVAEAGQ